MTNNKKETPPEKEVIDYSKWSPLPCKSNMFRILCRKNLDGSETFKFENKGFLGWYKVREFDSYLCLDISFRAPDITYAVAFLKFHYGETVEIVRKYKPV